MRTTRKSLETLCENVNEARAELTARTGHATVSWSLEEFATQNWSVVNAKGQTMAAGLTMGECERFLYGALAVLRS